MGEGQKGHGESRSSLRLHLEPGGGPEGGEACKPAQDRIGLHPHRAPAHLASLCNSASTERPLCVCFCLVLCCPPCPTSRARGPPALTGAGCGTTDDRRPEEARSGRQSSSATASAKCSPNLIRSQICPLGAFTSAAGFAPSILGRATGSQPR